MGVRSEVGRVVRESWREVRAENVTFMAGSIAYHAFVSMLPLLVVLLVVLSAVGNEEFTAYLAELTGSFLTPYARRLLVESLNVTAARTGTSVVGGVTLLWGISKIFRGLDVAFSEIYDVEAKKTLLDQVENAVVVLFALGAAVAAFLAAGVVVALVPDLPYPPVLNPVLLVAGLTVAFFPIYYVFPDVDLTLREVVPGVVVAAVGWAALEAVFQGYVIYATRYEATYGALGSALLLLVWLYFGGLVLLLGGVVNAVLAGRTGDEHALHVTEDVSDRDAGGRDERVTASDLNPRTSQHDELARSSEISETSSERLGRAAEELDAERQRPRTRVEHLEAENQRLEVANERLEAENERLKRDKQRLRAENEALTRRLARRRSIRARAKRWLFGERK